MVIIDKKLMFTVILATSPFFLKSCFAQDNSIGFVVVLDAGHGGHDSGNTGNGYLEKKIAWNDWESLYT